ncbi:MAG: class I SAM-dependent methyltransferase [Bacteroidetes bacterium]|nr:class I SAM-dependent methyltransferase [Bacteroidota bacterium]
MNILQCKICQSKNIEVKYKIKGINYYYCPSCDFLFSVVLDSVALDEQKVKNHEMRNAKWDQGRIDEVRKRWRFFTSIAFSKIFWHSATIYSSLIEICGREPNFCKRKLRILDFGCGHGLGVEMLRDDGHDAIGVDPFSPVEKDYIIRKSLKDANFESSYFDLILSIESIEHITYPMDTMYEFKRILRPNGCALIQTGWLDSPQAKEGGKDWFYLEDPDVHVCIYSSRSFNKVRELVGFSKLRLKPYRYAAFYR